MPENVVHSKTKTEKTKKGNNHLRKKQQFFLGAASTRVKGNIQLELRGKRNAKQIFQIYHSDLMNCRLDFDFNAKMVNGHQQQRHKRSERKTNEKRKPFVTLTLFISSR